MTMPLTTLVDALPTLALAGEQARFTVDLLVVLAAAAALGVAFNAKPAVRAVADAQINIPNLDVALALANI